MRKKEEYWSLSGMGSILTDYVNPTTMSPFSPIISMIAFYQFQHLYHPAITRWSRLTNAFPFPQTFMYITQSTEPPLLSNSGILSCVLRPFDLLIDYGQLHVQQSLPRFREGHPLGWHG